MQIFCNFVSKLKGEDVWADAGYASAKEEFAKKKVNPIICEKGRRNHPLTQEQKKSNREKSKMRSRVEHVFGFIERSIGRPHRNGQSQSRCSNDQSDLQHNTSVSNIQIPS